MSHSPSSPPSGGENPYYETSDARARPLVIFTLLMTITVIAVMWITVGLLDAFDSYEEGLREPAHPMAEFQERTPGVFLQTRTTPDLERYRVQQEEWMNSFGAVDPQQKRCRVPVELAKEKMLERGFETKN